MRPILALVALIACASIIGCKSKSGITGEWQGSEPNPLGGGPTPVTAKFDPSGTYSLTMGSGQINSEISGTYKYDDSTKQLTLNQSSMKLGGQEVKVTSGNLMGEGPPQAVTWKSDNEIVINMPMGAMDLTRK